MTLQAPLQPTNPELTSQGLVETDPSCYLVKLCGFCLYKPHPCLWLERWSSGAPLHNIFLYIVTPQGSNSSSLSYFEASESLFTFNHKEGAGGKRHILHLLSFNCFHKICQTDINVNSLVYLVSQLMNQAR